jgi:hypothetical protein
VVVVVLMSPQQMVEVVMVEREAEVRAVFSLLHSRVQQVAAQP